MAGYVDERTLLLENVVCTQNEYAIVTQVERVSK